MYFKRSIYYARQFRIDNNHAKAKGVFLEDKLKDFAVVKRKKNDPVF